MILKDYKTGEGMSIPTNLSLDPDLYASKELIDYDVIKGSALFNTRPSKHNHVLVRRAFYRLLFFPLHFSHWKTKFPRWSWVRTACGVYLLHVFSVLMYFIYPYDYSNITFFEVIFPPFLLILVAGAYARASGLLFVADPKTGKLIDSPSRSSKKETSLGLDTALLESDDSSQDGTDSEGESSHSMSSSSSSSEDEVRTVCEEKLFETSEITKKSEETSKKNHNLDNMSLLLEKSKSSSKISMKRMNYGKQKRRMSAGSYHRIFGSYRSFGDNFTRRKVNVRIWSENGFPQKCSLNIAELRSRILIKVKSTSPRKFYFRFAIISSTLVAFIPIIFRLIFSCSEYVCSANTDTISMFDKLSNIRKFSANSLWIFIFNYIFTIPTVISFSCSVSTLFLSYGVFTSLSEAEMTYYRRFMYAKCFNALTSSRRARAMGLPHFRLKNVVNIKAWLSLRGGRSWLKRQGRQRATDEIVSTSFLIILVLLVVMGFQVVAGQQTVKHFQSLLHIEVCIWCLLSSVFLLRFMMLGSKINRKYQSTSLLLTEQMNVYLRLLQAPQKKDKLLISNNVLKIATKLLKELHSPNKISGITMNPLLYNITRVIVLSAFSATLSEFLGFKLKLWKLKAI